MSEEGDTQQLADHIRAQPDEVLLRMVTSEISEFRPEALSIARNELRLRSVAIPEAVEQPVRSRPASPVNSRRSWQDIVGRIGASIHELPWPVVFGYVLFLSAAVVFYADPRSRQGERGIYTLSVLMNALVLTEWGVFAKWGQQPGGTKARAVFWAVMALAWNVNCLMYLVGVRSLESRAP